MFCDARPEDAVVSANKVGFWSDTIYWQHGPREFRLKPQEAGQGLYGIDEWVRAWVRSEELPAKPYWTNVTWLGGGGGGTICGGNMWEVRDADRVVVHLEAAKEPSDLKFVGVSGMQAPWLVWAALGVAALLGFVRWRRGRAA